MQRIGRPEHGPKDELIAAGKTVLEAQLRECTRLRERIASLESGKSLAALRKELTLLQEKYNLQAFGRRTAYDKLKHVEECLAIAIRQNRQAGDEDILRILSKVRYLLS
jgi:hypothetical protein